MKRPTFHQQALDVLEMALRRAESEAKRWTEEAARLRLELAKERKR